jgi:eukaryotic-like serine/threonine-protein kinase
VSEPIERLATALADRYRIVRELGQGGMATVYLAEDLKHHRKVALKVLRPELGAMIGSERFLHEISITANLQHPHILQLHDSGSADGLLFYVMPYVEGESLRDRLLRDRQTSVEDAVGIARGVAAALDYAHRRGVIHRDIKPENILLIDGQPVVADFGIALAVNAAGGTRLTETGLSLGTPHYMSPEQATGQRDVGGRTDIYSLGCVLYEMLAGEPPFTGPSAQAIVAKLITERPQRLSLYRDTVPPHVEAATLKALAKVPADRFTTAHEFADAISLEGSAARPSTVVTAVVGHARAGSRVQAVLRSPAVAWTAAGVLGLLALWLGLRPAAGGSWPAHLSLQLPASQRLMGRSNLAWSPDGQTLVLSAAGPDGLRLLARRLDQDSVMVIPGSDGAYAPSFSPDGRWLVYFSSDGLKKLPLAGGKPTTLAADVFGRPVWAPDGTIIYNASYQSGLWRVAADGGTPAKLTEPDRAKGELGHWEPELLPDGHHVLFTVFTTPADKSRIEVLSLDDGKREVVVEGGYFPRYLADGHLTFIRGGTLMAVGLDPRRRRVIGSPVPVLDDPRVETQEGRAGVAVAPNGNLAYVAAGSGLAKTQLLWLDRTGRTSPALDSLGEYKAIRVSPDGRRWALLVGSPADLWVYNRDRAFLTRVTRTPENEASPVWTRDGRDLIFSREVPQFDLFRRPADGGGTERRLLTSASDKHALSVSPDGRLVFYQESLEHEEIRAMPVDSGAPASVLKGSASLSTPIISPNGRWLAYTSTESGQAEIYVTSYPVATGGRHQVSRSGGTAPRWAPDGRSLFFAHRNALLRATFDPASGAIGTPTEWWQAGGTGLETYDIAPDGRALLIVSPPEQAAREVRVVLNWSAELKDRLRPGR